jgi:N-acetylglutamate synthase and related acetyltransferases
MLKLLKTTSENADFVRLIAELDADLNSRYGALQAQYDAYNRVEMIDTLIVAYADNQPVGCGCFKKLDDTTVEIKRMFVRPSHRGRGIAIRILTELEAWAKSLDYDATQLETGIKQTEAIGLYGKLGYTMIDNYGQYAGNENSVCMRKKL